MKDARAAGRRGARGSGLAVGHGGGREEGSPAMDPRRLGRGKGLTGVDLRHARALLRPDQAATAGAHASRRAGTREEEGRAELEPSGDRKGIGAVGDVTASLRDPGTSLRFQKV